MPRGLMAGSTLAALVLGAVATLALLPAGALGKVVSGRGYFATSKVTEVTKFTFRPGVSHVSGNITYHDHPKGSIYMFMDTAWYGGDGEGKYHDEKDCDKIKHFHTRIPIGQQGKIGRGIGVAIGHEPFLLPKGNRYTWNFEWQITHAVRSYGWYFIIADCKGYEHGDKSEDGAAPPDQGAVPSARKRKLRKNLFEYDLVLLNPDGDHLPADEHGLTTLYFFVFVLMAGYFYKSTTDYKRRTGNGLVFDSHAVVKAFAFAYMFQIGSMLLEILHLWRYSSNGYGVFFFDFMSEFLEAMAQLIISFALICMANGWTLVDLSRAPNSGFLRTLLNRPTLDDETPTLFLLIIIVFVSTILQLISKLTSSDGFQQFHDHAGISGKFLIFQRLLFGVAFLFSINGTISTPEVQGKLQLQGFLKRLMVSGGIWFFAFPLLVAIAELWAHYLQHRFVTGGVLVIQSVCLTVMTSQLFSSSSVYSKISDVTSSGMLPGFGKGKVY